MFVVVGHRGCGMNRYSPFGRTDMLSIRENTITSFNMAARNGVQFVEFDVQVTKDGVPIIFHDDVILTDDTLPGKHIGDITLEEFRAMGPQRDSTKVRRIFLNSHAELRCLNSCPNFVMSNLMITCSTELTILGLILNSESNFRGLMRNGDKSEFMVSCSVVMRQDPSSCSQL